MIAYVLLFGSAFLAATLLPMQSEAVLVTQLVQGLHPALTLVVVATAGNVLGSVVNWYLGLSVLRFQNKRWFPASPAQLERAQGWYHRFGRWSLLASWVPIVGDPLTVIADRIAREARVICFDEFFVSDITDAMILAGLFEQDNPEQQMGLKGRSMWAGMRMDPTDIADITGAQCRGGAPGPGLAIEREERVVVLSQDAAGTESQQCAGQNNRSSHREHPS